ncbi:hypothetical protein EMIT051CA3_70153 [Pseudomonas chlororaphis]
MAIYSKKTADELGTAILRASRTACLTLFQHVEPLESATSRGPARAVPDSVGKPAGTIICRRSAVAMQTFQPDSQPSPDSIQVQNRPKALAIAAC